MFQSNFASCDDSQMADHEHASESDGDYEDADDEDQVSDDESEEEPAAEPIAAPARAPRAAANVMLDAAAQVRARLFNFLQRMGVAPPRPADMLHRLQRHGDDADEEEMEDDELLPPSYNHPMLDECSSAAATAPLLKTNAWVPLQAPSYVEPRSGR